jgi:L-aminopeptidase/D-esterase-like protein
MISWAQRANVAILQKDWGSTANTDESLETGVTSVLAVAPTSVFEKRISSNPAVQDTDSWRPLFIAYDIHAFNCPTCIAGGRGYGMRCGTGSSLWTDYQNH